MWEYICGYVKSSFSDWPGKIVPVMFVKGCNLRCPTCHNKKIAYLDKNPLPFQKKIILKDIQTKKNWSMGYEGIVLSGGEITQVPDLVKKLQIFKSEINLPIKIDTNGYMPGLLTELLDLELIDFVAVDVKAPWEKYHLATGINSTLPTIESIFFEIFKLAKQYPDKFQFRTTKVPLLTEEDLITIQSYLPSGFKLVKQIYRKEI